MQILLLRMVLVIVYAMLLTAILFFLGKLLNKNKGTLVDQFPGLGKVIDFYSLEGEEPSLSRRAVYLGTIFTLLILAMVGLMSYLTAVCNIVDIGC